MVYQLLGAVAQGVCTGSVSFTVELMVFMSTMVVYTYSVSLYLLVIL